MKVAMLLDELERALAGGLRHDARRAEVPEATARLLLALEPEEALPMRDLAERIDRDASTATRFADRAAEAGLVERIRGSDRRRRLLQLTPEGRLARDRLLRLRRERADRMARKVHARIALDTDQVEWFLNALSRALSS